MKYFDNCKTIEEVRDLYRDLAKNNHPDLGGDVKIMQEINVEYAKMTNVFTRANNPEETEQYYSEMQDVEEHLRKVLVELLKLDGLKVEICGVWIWVSGETYQYKTQLKELGLK